jgi:hypothetical protein
MLLIGYFEGIDSERGLEWRCADSLSLREFLRLAGRESVPDHSWLSRTRGRANIHKRYLIHVTGYNLGLIMRLLTGAGTPRELHARGSAYLFCVILPDAALLAIIAFADEHPIAVLAITFEAAPVHLNTGVLNGLLMPPLPFPPCRGLRSRSMRSAPASRQRRGWYGKPLGLRMAPYMQISTRHPGAASMRICTGPWIVA